MKESSKDGVVSQKSGVDPPPLAPAVVDPKVVGSESASQPQVPTTTEPQKSVPNVGRKHAGQAGTTQQGGSGSSV